MTPLAQLGPQLPQSPQLPPLPEGPDLGLVRAPIEEASSIGPLMLSLGIGASLVVVGLVVWLYLRSRNKEPSPIPPDIAALAELDAADSLAQDDLSFVTLCSGAVRRFLIANIRSGPGEGDTSTEFLNKLPVTKESRSHLSHFFARCDGVKFAQESLSESEKEDILKAARSFVSAFKEGESKE